MKRFTFYALFMVLGFSNRLLADDATDKLIKVLHGEYAHGDSVEASLALAKMGARAVPALTEALIDTNVRVRALSARALERIGPDAKAAVPSLALLVNGTASDAIAAMDALAAIGPDSQAAIPNLEKVLKEVKDPKKQTARLHAIIALGKMGPAAKEAVPALTEVLKGKEKGGLLRLHAAEALGRIGPDAKSALPALKDVSLDKSCPAHIVATEAIRLIEG